MLGLLIIGGLLGSLVLGDVFDSSDAPDPHVEEDTPPVEGIDILLTSESDATLNGTEGDDTLTSDSPLGTETSTNEVFLGAGDDTATTSLSGSEIYGGDGDDTMTADSSTNTLYGEAGDDTLAVGSSSAAFGGAGDDTISVETGATAFGGEGNDVLTFSTLVYGSSETSTMEGGAGDDELVNMREIGAEDDHSIYGGVSMAGGEGQDTFTLELELLNGQAAFGETAVNNSGGRITDFDPAEDSLVIDIERGPETADRDMSSATLNDTSYTYLGVTYTSTTLVMVFEGNANSDETHVSVRLDDVSGLTMDDIVINFI